MKKSVSNKNHYPKNIQSYIAGILVMLVVLLSSAAYAQPVAVRAYTDKSRVLLGEPLWLTLEVKTLNGAKAPAFKVDSIPHFEFIIKDSSKVLQNGDTTIYHQYYQLTSFDSGRWVIPQFTLRPFVKTSSILVDVVFTEDFDPQQPYHDVQEIKDVPFKMDAGFERWWYLAAAALILLVLVIYWATQPKKTQPENKITATETAYRKAIQSLQELKQRMPDKKSFYAGLVEIFRTYILERTGISSLQQTTGDLVEKIKPLMTEEGRYNGLSQVLYLSDLVKFAKYDPDDNESASAFEVVEDAIHYIESGLKNKPGG
ncbi:MAG TPA: hypothetical protein PKE30_16305 [Niabella sp.]|nr:hypothetical protein [Niabella sp.]